MENVRPPTAVVTGATSGLGLIAATEFARRGMRIVMPARDAARAERARAHIVAEVPGAEIDIVAADLTRLADVQAAGARIADDYAHIDVLVNNAGLHAFEQRITPDGYPEMVAVNYLAPWLLSRTLLPRLTSTPGARIVNVGSEASRRHGVLTLPGDLTDTRPFGARESSLIYGKTKLLNIMFSIELARRIEPSGVAVIAVDPGFNVTGLGRELSFARPLSRVLSWLNIGDPRRGAGLIVRAALDPSYALASGSYFSVRRSTPILPTAPGDAPAVRARLWEETERLLMVAAPGR
jgi:NAD(P)-dependent dehydrogenase (short-subunit alcohol dehydrogenase family)